jgi:hypothetical protein
VWDPPKKLFGKLFGRCFVFSKKQAYFEKTQTGMDLTSYLKKIKT